MHHSLPGHARHPRTAPTGSRVARTPELSVRGEKLLKPKLKGILKREAASLASKQQEAARAATTHTATHTVTMVAFFQQVGGADDRMFFAPERSATRADKEKLAETPSVGVKVMAP